MSTENSNNPGGRPVGKENNKFFMFEARKSNIPIQEFHLAARVSLLAVVTSEDDDDGGDHGGGGATLPYCPSVTYQYYFIMLGPQKPLPQAISSQAP